MSFEDVRILLIDNYDSFTYNLVQAFREQGAGVVVHRNDEIDVDAAIASAPSHLVISPGPGRPENAGNSVAMIAAFTGSVPILGVCLGHQCIVQHFGGEIVRNERLMHGKTSQGRTRQVRRCSKNCRHRWKLAAIIRWVRRRSRFPKYSR